MAPVTRPRLRAVFLRRACVRWPRPTGPLAPVEHATQPLGSGKVSNMSCEHVRCVVGVKGSVPIFFG